MIKDNYDNAAAEVRSVVVVVVESVCIFLL